MKITVLTFRVSEKLGVFVKSKDGRLFYCVNPETHEWKDITPETIDTTDDRL